ncbi:helix-turn-helix domain-containing protein [Streptomyces sp. NPDC056468]|uniref:helix-turn-helix domain-containing protein n=1 Tax=Streptomyces sp. NPDC056468 TaxID=3345830 RepID=UPI0036836BA8
MEFTEKLGVSDRIVSRWEADSEQASLRMVNQAALDTLLAKADKDAQGRFVGILAVDDVPTRAIIEPDGDQTSSGEYVKHPGDGKLMAHVPEGIFLSGEDDEPVWVDDLHIDTFPTTTVTPTTPASVRPLGTPCLSTGRTADVPATCTTTLSCT